MSDVNIFSNKPFFCQKPLSTAEVLNLPIFNAMTQANPDTCSWNACNDPNMATTWRKNVLHKAIRCGGQRIDFNFMEEMFPGLSSPTMVNSKTWYNHYNCDPDYNIYAAATVVGTTANGTVTFQIIKANHGGSGAFTNVVRGYNIVDKETQTFYTVTAVDTTTDYAHKVTVTPNEAGIVPAIYANKAYLVLPAAMIGGCSCPLYMNKMQSIGYSKQVKPIRVRNDWKLCIDLLRGYEDIAQFAVIYDMQGNPVDSWDALEAQSARQALRAFINAYAFIGSPTTNPNLIANGTSITVDDAHTGFYGLIPELKYGGGNVYNYRPDLGFDLEADGEPIFLYQDSRKRTKKFMVMHGQKFMFNLIDRTNKLVRRSDLGANVWEAYKRLGQVTGEDYSTAMAKLGIDSYTYQGFELDFKKMDSWSDYRWIGADVYNDMAIMVPQDGVTEYGQPLNPIEFNTYGNGGWTGMYEEFIRDMRKVDGCEDLAGYVAESIAMSVHCPNQFVLVNPIKAA